MADLHDREDRKREGQELFHQAFGAFAWSKLSIFADQ
jgi:hypothetical protein